MASSDVAGELRHGYLSLIENLAQTVGVLSPAGTISVIIPLLILTAGNGTWLLLLATLSIFLMVMLCVMRFAALHSSAGSLAAYAQLGLGRRAGLVGAWIYFFGIAYCVPSALLTSAAYFDIVLAGSLGPPGSTLRLQTLVAVLTVACWLAAYRDIKLSTNLMLVIECTSVTLMLVLTLAGMIHAHAWVDRAQLHLDGVHFRGLQSGLVLAFMLMAGFEGTTSLGEEAQNAQHTIPRAIAGCMLPLTVVYLLVTYCLVSLENRGVIRPQADGLTVPFHDIAHALQFPWLGLGSSLGVGASYFACALGSLTIAARVLFSMARDGQVWRPFGVAHPRNATPHRAIAAISLASMAIPLALLARGAALDVGISFLSQLASLGLIGGYFVVVIALPLYLKRRGLLRAKDIMLAAAAGSTLVLVLLLSVFPRPPHPYNYLVYLFAGSTTLGICVSLWLGARAQRADSAKARQEASLFTR